MCNRRRKPKPAARRPSRKRRKAAAVLFMGGFDMREVARLLRIPYGDVMWSLRKTLCVLAWLVLVAASPAFAQISVPNTFTLNTTADPTQVNANFAAVGNNALNRTGGTMTGTLTSQAITPATDALYALGDATHRYTGLSLSGATAGGVMYGTGTALAFNAAGTSGQVLLSGGAGVPTWGDFAAFWNTGDAYVTTNAGCRAGFTDVSAANNGYYIVIGNANINSTVGTALSTSGLENRATGQHTHGVTDPGHSHNNYADKSGLGGGSADLVGEGPGTLISSNIVSNTTGITIQNAGGVAGTNAPYKVFRLCQK